jgi:predicted enzyme related to lactoylglutathione lyase
MTGACTTPHPLDTIQRIRDPQGARSFWLSYLSVANVDETARRIASAGGATLRQGFEMQGIGRIAVVRDRRPRVVKGESQARHRPEGRVLWPPNDIPRVGRATVFSDPTGATLAAIAPVR